MKRRESYSLIAKGEFTQSCSQILTRVSVASGKGVGGKSEEGIAVWDTGAESCGISKRMAERLGLEPLDWKKVIHYADGTEREEDVYLVKITFLPSGYPATLYAFEFGSTGEDMLIGMDIIRNGRFLLEPDGEGGVRFTFTI